MLIELSHVCVFSPHKRQGVVEMFNCRAPSSDESLERLRVKRQHATAGVTGAPVIFPRPPSLFDEPPIPSKKVALETKLYASSDEQQLVHARKVSCIVEGWHVSITVRHDNCFLPLEPENG